MLEGNVGLVVANEPGVMGQDAAAVTILSRDGSSRRLEGTKDNIAAEILSAAIDTFSLSRPA